MATSIKIAICPACGSDMIELMNQDWQGKYQGMTYIVPALQYYECPDCGEKIYDRDAMRKIEAHSPALASSPQSRKSA